MYMSMQEYVSNEMIISNFETFKCNYAIVIPLPTHRSTVSSKI